MGSNRYAILTVDTEALPKRATDDHVNRLMWGQHAGGRAGVGEMASIGNEFGARHVFFVDLCGAYARRDEILDVVRWLDRNGQDVQLHTHPEYLPAEFWSERGLSPLPQYMNQYTEDSRAELVISHFSSLISGATGKPVLAHRAGSFRWNACTIRALQAAGIALSFNNSTSALHAGQSVYAEPTNQPFLWSNGVIEVPMTEKKILPRVGKDEWWARLTYPESPYFHFDPWWGKLLLNVISGSPDLAVFLLHSWSLLYWDDDGHATFRDYQRLDGYRKLLSRLTRDYDVITSAEFLDLHASGKIRTTHQTDLARAEVASAAQRTLSGRPRKDPFAVDDKVWSDEELPELLAENRRLQALVDVQQQVRELEAENALNVRIGNLLIDAADAPRRLLATPGRLLRIWYRSARRTPPAALGGKDFGKVIAAWESGGFAEVEALLAKVPASAAMHANAWTALARRLMEKNRGQAAKAARRAYALDPKPFRLKWLAFRMQEAGKLIEAEAMLSLLPADTPFSESDRTQAARLRRDACRLREREAKLHTGSVVLQQKAAGLPRRGGSA